MDKCAIVILNWNGIDFLKKFLPGVTKYSEEPDTCICIADNGSTDGSCQWISETYPGIRLIVLKENHGFAGGYNLALAQIEAEYFVLLNSDVEVTPGWLSPLVDCLEGNSAIAACQPKILSWVKRDTFEYAGAAGGFIDKMGYPFCRGRVLHITEIDHGQYNNQTEIFWSTGACMIIRAEAWRKCGGFDKDFFAHMEEIDLCWRLHNAGYKIIYMPDSTVYHVGGGSLPYNSPRKTFLNFRNSLFMLYKNLPSGGFRRKMLCRRLLDGVAALFFLVRGEFKSFSAVWKAHMEFYRSLNTLKSKRKNTNHDSSIDFSGLILNKSLVVEFYLKGHKTFNSLVKTNSK